MTKRPVSLDNIRVASPCPANWDEMTALDESERVKFCGQCQLNVYNLSAMSKAEAEALVASKEGRMCIRYYQRTDGTIITKDCPIGVEIKHKKVLKLKRAGIAAAIALVTFAGVFTVKAYAGQGNSVQTQTPPSAVAGGIMLPPPQQPEVMGEMVAPPPPQDKPPLMGKPIANPKNQPVMGSPPADPPKEDNNNQDPDEEASPVKQGKVEVKGRIRAEMGDIAYPPQQ